MNLVTVHLTDEQIDAWINDRLDSAAANDVESHLLQCDECARRIDELPQQTITMYELLQHENGKRTTNRAAMEETAIAPNQDAGALDPIESLRNANRWKIDRLLTKGGIGEIYLATDSVFDRKVVVKKLRPEFADISSVQERFIREARITAQLAHPGTVFVLDLVEAGRESYYVMSLVEGDTLSERIKAYHHVRASDAWGSYEQFIDLLNIFVAVTHTIAYAHANGVLHRDIKPANVIIGRYGRINVLDWGLAKRIGEHDIASHLVPSNEREHHVDSTLQGSRLGTPCYMSPEQVAGNNKAIDERTDVYSLCVMLFEIITGRLPFESSDLLTLFDQITYGEAPRFEELGIKGVEGLESLCRLGMKKEPDERLLTAEKLGAAVKHWVASEVHKREIESEREQFFSFTKDLMAILKDDFGIRWANKAWFDALGWTAEELVGKRESDLVHPDDQTRVFEVLRRVRAGGSVSGIEPRMLCKDGSYKWFLWTASRVVSENMTYVIGHDIDARRRREDTYCRLLDASPDAMIVVDMSLVIRYANSTAEQLSGYSASELIGQSLNMLLPATHHAEHNMIAENYFENPRPMKLSSRSPVGLRNKSGQNIRVQISLNPVETPEGLLIASALRAVV